MSNVESRKFQAFQVRDYDLAATLSSGQAFRWKQREDRWVGVVEGNWVSLRQAGDTISAEVAEPENDWRWLADYLQVNLDLDSVLATFPADEPMQAAVAACRGLRLLRQEPWECLASFILSSTKQIVQIRQIVDLVCTRFGEAVAAPASQPDAFAFPTPERIARASEAELRGCKMGFRAKYLLAAAQVVADGRLDLEQVRHLPLEAARAELRQLAGVGAKIANCVLLFAYDFPAAFPVDVWVARAVRQLYFPRRAPSMSRMKRFVETHFGPNAGYAQQYLFHYMRMKSSRLKID